MDNQSFSKIWILVIIVIIFAGGILVWRYKWKGVEIVPVKSETTKAKVEQKDVESVPEKATDWKAYRNEEYNYELKYPKDWYVYDYSYDGTRHPEDVIIQNFSRPKEGGYSGIGGAGCQINIRVFQGYSSLEERIEEEKINIGDALERVSTKDILIGNVKGYEVTFFGSFLGTGKPIILLFKEGNLYEIYRNWQDVSEEVCKLDFNQILSTFRFLE